MTKTHKTCLGCNELKTIDNFYVNTRSTHVKGKSWNPRCKPCVSERQRLRYRDNTRRAKHYKLTSTYGITIDQYEGMLESQGNCCAICKGLEPGGNGYKFYVDHNHETKEVRGLLCHHCNFLLGYAKENREILVSAIEYLNHWGKPSQP